MTTRGRRPCGSLTCAAETAPAAPIACRRGPWQRQSGRYRAASQGAEDALAAAGNVTWFGSSPGMRRGRSTCGNAMSRRRAGEGTAPAPAGSSNAPEGISLKRQVFAKHAGRHREIADGLTRP